HRHRLSSPIATFFTDYGQCWSNYIEYSRLKSRLLPRAASGTALVYSTYLGGSDFDHGQGIAVDGFGNAYITGHTESDDFPIRAAFQSVHRDAEGITDAFVTKLLVISFGFPAHLALSLGYSTYLGGTDKDEGHAIA